VLEKPALDRRLTTQTVQDESQIATVFLQVVVRKIRGLRQALPQREMDPGFQSRIQEAYTQYRSLLEADRQNLHKPIHPGAVIQALKKHAPENAIICSDVGDHTYWLYKRFVCEGQTTLLCANMAGMGFGIPAAVACSFAEPGRRVIAVTGDGGFGMAGMEFTTAVHNRLLLTIVVFNDGKLKNIKKEMEEYGYPEYRVDFPNPDFARFASTAGGTGFYVEEPEDLDEAFRKALASSGPSLIDVRVDPDKYIEAIHRV